MRITPLLCLAISGLAFSEDRRPLIAVMPITTKSLDANAAETITDALASELVNTGAVRVMERSEMQRILAEQSFSSSGACDSGDCTVRIGKLLSVDQMVVGSLGKIGNTFSFSARLVSIKTGEIVKAVTKNGPAQTDALLSDLLPAVAAGLVSGTSTPKPQAKSAPPPKAESVATEPANPVEVATVEKKTRFRLTPLVSLGEAFSTFGDSTELGSSNFSQSSNGGVFSEVGARFEWTPTTHIGLGLQGSIGFTSLSISGTYNSGTSTSDIKDDILFSYVKLGARFEWKWAFGLYAATGVNFIRPLSGTEDQKVNWTSLVSSATLDTTYHSSLSHVSAGDAVPNSSTEGGILSWTEWTLEPGWAFKNGWRVGLDIGIGLGSASPRTELDASGNDVYKSPSADYSWMVHRVGIVGAKSFSF